MASQSSFLAVRPVWVQGLWLSALTSLQTLNHHQHIASLSSSSSLTLLLSALSFDFAADYRNNWANILIIFAAAFRFGAQNKAIKRVPPSHTEEEEGKGSEADIVRETNRVGEANERN